MSDGKVKCDPNGLWLFFTDTRKCQENLDEHFRDLYAKLRALDERLEKEAAETGQEIERLETEKDSLMQRAAQEQIDLSEKLSKLRGQIEILQDHKMDVLRLQKEIPDKLAVLDHCKKEYQTRFQECRKIINRYLQMLEIETVKGEMTDCGEPAGNGRYYSMSYRGTTFYCSDALFDAGAKNADGKTNLQLMQEGNAPIGYDGKPVELHHMQQSERIGGIMEISSTSHRENHGVLHINTHDIPSGINRMNFNVLKKAYWKRRAEQIIDGG